MNGLIISQKANLHKVIKNTAEPQACATRERFGFDVSRKAVALLFSCALSCELFGEDLTNKTCSLQVFKSPLLK